MATETGAVESAETFAERLHHCEEFWRDHLSNRQIDLIRQRDAALIEAVTTAAAGIYDGMYTLEIREAVQALLAQEKAGR